MQAPERFCIILTGNISDVRSRNVVDDSRALKHLLNELLSGTPLPDDAFRAWRLDVQVEWDMDQGPEG